MLLKWSKFTLQFAAAVAIGTILQPVAAFAQDAAPIEGVFDWLVGVLQGNIARSIAIIAVCFLGFMAMT
ncbi:TrbC/VirB2 family protein, partial [Mesorhizobium sp.]|uniref:TrbC/VirB2 family protein n=1 Tax=Mesorhizobium sp. TaxID=1871066 RepID=UPI0025803026